MEKGLYIHIPFCSNICSYCDFAKVFYNQSLADLYIDEVINEIKERKCNNISSIYIGGGTPSSLTCHQLEKLLSFVHNNFYKEGISFAIEANVENLDESKIELLSKYKVNRVSLGVQSFNDELIKKMNRKHNYQMVVDTISLLRKYHIDNINCDFYYSNMAISWLLATAVVKCPKETLNYLNNNKLLNPFSNILFGEGGAGTFSDGKLTTGIKSEYIRFVLKEFIK